MTTTADHEERIAEERAAQALWRLRVRRPETRYFDQLLQNEFAAAEAHGQANRKRLARVVAFAAESVPYYRDLFARLKLSPADVAAPEHLPRLPELDKAIIGAEGARLRPKALPEGEVYAGSNTSSGSTGKPTVIHRTRWTRFLDLAIEQRQQRWYRFDPMGLMAWIRLPKNLPLLAPGRPVGLGETCRADSWPHLSLYFETGPFCGFADTNPLAEQVAWLESNRPTYARIASGNLEHLAFAFQDRPRLDSLKGLRAASEPLSPGMRARIEGTFGVPVHISFGMDEVGWIATRCDAGRYHVHTERFLIEIVDETGKPVPPGSYGRVLLTDVGNAAMPLLRYVTDDVAEALDDSPCPCGRTLPAFGDIVGRHSRTAGLPEGTMALVGALRETMERLPRELSRTVREYQIRQDAAGDFTLGIVAVAALPDGLAGHVTAAWNKALAERPPAAKRPALDMREVPAIPRAPSGKFFHFVSDLARPAEPGDRAANASPAAGGP